jgi:hypothetical protein
MRANGNRRAFGGWMMEKMGTSIRKAGRGWEFGLMEQ